MEKKLSQLFDLQRFQQNPRLNSVLQEVEGRYAGAVADDDLDLVNAAGEAHIPPDNEQGVKLVGAIMVPEGEES